MSSAGPPRSPASSARPFPLAGGGVVPPPGLSGSARYRFPLRLAAIVTVINWPLIIAGLFVCCLLIGLTAGHSSRVWLTAAVGIITLTASQYLHELAHWLILRRHTPVRIVRRRLRLMLLHHPVPAARDRLSALAGPAAGCLAALMAGRLAIHFQLSTAHLLCQLIAGWHGAALLPWYGDGQSLRRRAPSRSNH